MGNHLKQKKQPVLHFAIALYALFCLLPLLLVIIVSFSSDESVIHRGFTFFPEAFSLKAYKYVFSFGKQLIQSYLVTLIVSIGGTIWALAVMTPFAYSLSRRNFCLRGPLSVMMLITMLFSGGTLATYIVETNLYHLKDTIAALILPGFGVMYVIVLRTYIQSNIPESIFESAKIDGAGEWRIFFQLCLSMMLPALASIGFLLFVGYWTDWQQAYLYITSPSKTPLQLLMVRIEKNIDFMTKNANIPPEEMARLRKEIPTETGQMAVLVFVSGPILIAYPFFQRYFIKGITMGAIKG